MKAAAQHLQAQTASIPRSAFTRDRLMAYLELAKPGISTMVVLTALAGFYMASLEPMNLLLLIPTLLGVALSAAGASALNMLLERKEDGLMQRTENRPLPSGRIQPKEALIFGLLLSASGLLLLTTYANHLAAILTAASIAIYLFCYTPLKKKNPLSIPVGAISGALPPMIGWISARGGLNLEAWTLFAILFLWQMPHFYAIARMYREDYARAGFLMIPKQAGLLAIVFTLILLGASLAPGIFFLSGKTYGVGALLLGGGFLFCALRFSRELSVSNARQLFLASIIYLPLLLGLLSFTKA